MMLSASGACAPEVGGVGTKFSHDFFGGYLSPTNAPAIFRNPQLVLILFGAGPVGQPLPDMHHRRPACPALTLCAVGRW
jgi:hypothetical protein